MLVPTALLVWVRSCGDGGDLVLGFVVLGFVGFLKKRINAPDFDMWDCCVALAEKGKIPVDEATDKQVLSFFVLAGFALSSSVPLTLIVFS